MKDLIIDQVVDQADEKGIDSIDAATGLENGPWAIVMTEYYFGQEEITTPCLDDNHDVLTFNDFSAAEEYVHKNESGIYRLSYGEYTPATYKIVAVS